jgi:PGF-CTERM protein
VQTKENVMRKETPTATLTPISTVPGFEVVFAIGSLLAVAYLVLRRRG